MESKNNKSGVKKLVVVTSVSTLIWWLCTRKSIEVSNIDHKLRSLTYKVTVGLKSVKGEASVYTPSDQSFKFGAKTLFVFTHETDYIKLVLKDEKGETIDEVVTGFNLRVE